MWANHTCKNFHTQLSPEATPIASLCRPCFICFTPTTSQSGCVNACQSFSAVPLPISVPCIRTSKEISLPPTHSQNIVERKSICAPERSENIQQLSESTGQLNSLVCFTVHGTWQDKTPAVLTKNYQLISSFFAFWQALQNVCLRLSFFPSFWKLALGNTDGKTSEFCPTVHLPSGEFPYFFQNSQQICSFSAI